MVSCLSLALRRKALVYEKEKQTEDKGKVQMTYLNKDYDLNLRITHKFYIQNKWFISRRKV